ncbi:MAG: DUF4410 domain-containing protein [Planctomycetota bacterium]
MLPGFALLSLAPLSGGCVSAQCVLKKTDAAVDLRKYTTCYVGDADSAHGVVVPTSVLRSTPDRIASELRGREAFNTVSREPPAEPAQYLRIRTTYTNYRPGSRALRFMLIGLGTADLKMEVKLEDGTDGRQLATGRVHEFWGWGGLLGMSRGIEDLQKSAAKHIGEGIDKACGQSGRRR